MTTARRLPVAWFALVGYALLALALFFFIWQAPAARWIGSGKDPELFMWYLGWIPHALTHGQSPLTTDYLSYPAGVNLMWNTSMLFPALVLWPVTAAFGPAVSYNLLMTSALALSAWAGFLAARRFIDQSLASFVAGGLYGFGPGMLAQTFGHPQTTVALFPPIALILADEILVRQRLQPLLAGSLAGLAAALQLLTGEEVLAVTLLLGVPGVLLLALLHRGRVAEKAPYALRAVAAAVVVGGAAAAYPLAVQFLGPQRVFSDVQPRDVYVSDLWAFIVPGHQWLQPDYTLGIVRRFTGNRTENDAYLGIPLIATFVAGLFVCRRRPPLVWAGLMALLIVLLSMGPHLHIRGRITGIVLPWDAVARLPLFGNVLPSRLMTIAMLGISLVVAGMLAELWSRGIAWRAAGVLMLVASVAAIVPELPYPSHPAGAPAFFAAGGDVARLPEGSVVLVTPFSSKESADAMYWQTLSGYRFRMPEGDAFTPGPYLGPRPTYLQAALDRLDRGQPADMSEQSLGRARADLGALGVQAVVAGPSRGREAIVSFLSAVIGAPPVQTGGVDVWWSV